MSADDLYARAEVEGQRVGIARERERVVRFLRAEAEWLQMHPALNELPPHAALTIVAEAIESGEYLIVPQAHQTEP